MVILVRTTEQLLVSMKTNSKTRKGYNINGKLDKDNMQESLNRLHEHFPVSIFHENNFKIRQALKEYNLVIHWLEASLNFYKQTILTLEN